MFNRKRTNVPIDNSQHSSQKFIKCFRLAGMKKFEVIISPAFKHKLVFSAFALLFTEISVVWVTEISVASLKEFL